MKEVKTIVITIERELEENSSISQLNQQTHTNRVIHVDGEELYRDSLQSCISDSDDIIRQLERFLEGRMDALPAGARKWYLFSGTETVPEKEVNPIAINIESLTGPIQILAHPDILKDSLICGPDMSELHRLLFHSLNTAIEDGISIWKKSIGLSRPQKESPQ